MTITTTFQVTFEEAWGDSMGIVKATTDGWTTTRITDIEIDGSPTDWTQATEPYQFDLDESIAPNESLTITVEAERSYPSDTSGRLRLTMFDRQRMKRVHTTVRDDDPDSKTIPFASGDTIRLAVNDQTVVLTVEDVL